MTSRCTVPRAPSASRTGCGGRSITDLMRSFLTRRRPNLPERTCANTTFFRVKRGCSESAVSMWRLPDPTAWCKTAGSSMSRSACSPSSAVCPSTVPAASSQSISTTNEKRLCVDHLSRRVGAIYREVTQLYPPEHALDAARRLWTRRGIAEVEVSEVRFCYYETGWNDRQRYLQPAYTVIATLFGPDRRIRTGNIYVSPAAVNHVGRIAPAAPPRRIAQEPRREQGGDSPPGRAR